MKAKITIKSIMFLLATVFLLASCASKEDKFVGSWSRSFGLNTNPYTEFRAFSTEGTHPTYFHSFVFEKGIIGKNKFTDVVTPLPIGRQPGLIAVGSKVTGSWEIKTNKLYLYYDDEVKLINCDNLNPEEIEVLEEQMCHQFLEIYRKMGENGLPYKLYEKNNKVVLEIQFGNDELILVKGKDKEM